MLDSADKINIKIKINPEIKFVIRLWTYVISTLSAFWKMKVKRKREIMRIWVRDEEKENEVEWPIFRITVLFFADWLR